MKYKIIKKSEYDKLLRIKMAQDNSIIILDDQLNNKTAENVMLQVEIANAREVIKRLRDELNKTHRELIAYNAANARLRKELGCE